MKNLMKILKNCANEWMELNRKQQRCGETMKILGCDIKPFGSDST